MVVTEVVEAADNIHAGSEGVDLPGKAASAPGQMSQSLAEGSVEPLDVGGIDDTTALQ